jgi:hypothetical protein
MSHRNPQTADDGNPATLGNIVNLQIKSFQRKKREVSGSFVVA